MPDKKDFGYSFPCDGPVRGGTCDISAWDAFYLAVHECSVPPACHAATSSVGICDEDETHCHLWYFVPLFFFIINLFLKLSSIWRPHDSRFTFPNQIARNTLGVRTMRINATWLFKLRICVALEIWRQSDLVCMFICIYTNAMGN